MRKLKKLTAFLLALLLLGQLLAGCADDREPQASVPEETTGEVLSGELRLYREKAELLRARVITPEVKVLLGEAPASSVNHVVFLSVCDTASRARSYTGTGETLEEAWAAANAKAEAAVTQLQLEPVWMKADVVYTSHGITAERLAKEVLSSRHEFYRWGVAFDFGYETALQEALMNGCKIYEYEEGGIDFSYLNTYLKKAGIPTLEALPDTYLLFQCLGWFCGEDLVVHELYDQGLEYGRRKLDRVDGAYARQLLIHAADFLVDQVREDGSFVYGMYPRFDNDIENYNIVRHVSTLWSLVCRYRMEPSRELEQVVDRAFDYMMTQILYDGEDTAYLYEAKSDEIKLGGNGVAIVAMTEYMDAFGSDKYVDLCRKLGNGILTMLDQQTGEYYHVLNGDFTRKEAFRTVYYDGEATFGLCRLYSVTGEQQWLDAAASAVDHFIEADYAQHKDHWVAYSMNEITKHITDNDAYYAFAVHNVQSNLDRISQRDTTYHTYLELLMSSFELFDRIGPERAEAYGLDLEKFLDTIYTRVNRQLNGYFYPEYAMYMENPQRVLNTFMVRHDGYRIRIDDVQHNIGGYYLYFKHYDRLTEWGLPAA